MRTWILGVAMLLSACKGGETDTIDTDGLDTDGGDTDDTEVTDTGYPSTFTDGKYRLTAFVLMDADLGADLDGDGTQDNNLPKLLDVAAIALSGVAISPEDVNAMIAQNIDTGAIAEMLDAHHAEQDLSIDAYSGSMDIVTGDIGIDPLSYDQNGDPRSRFVGDFSTETTFAVSSDEMLIAVPFMPDEAALLVPIQQATLSGELTIDASSGMLVGVVPGQEVLDNVVAPLIPAEGVDTDGDGQIDLTHDQLLETATAVVNNENMSDIVFDDGSRGISVAFTYVAVPAEFEP